MRTSRAAIGSAAFFIVAPGTVVGLIPWWISRWEFHNPLPYWWIAQVIGVILICVGLVPVLNAFTRFSLAGGTPLPAAAPPKLVVGGFNRYVRNPMYVGLIVVILGQALLFGQAGLLLYAVLVWAIPAIFVKVYEEPTLSRRFGAEYEAYRRAVPAWIPRLHPWDPGQDATPPRPA